jgi:hypothetical protein
MHVPGTLINMLRQQRRQFLPYNLTLTFRFSYNICTALTLYKKMNEIPVLLICIRVQNNGTQRKYTYHHYNSSLITRTVNSTSYNTLRTLYRTYFKGISDIIELQEYSVM